MVKRYLATTAAVLLLGAGCTGSGAADTTSDTASADQTNGKEICLRTDGDATGHVQVFAADVTTGSWDNWFSGTPLGEGDAGTDICGATSFALQAGDQLLINGDWSDGTRWLVENQGEKGSGSDVLRELWIDNQYYEVGKECEYQANGVNGFDLACTIQ